MSSGIVSDACDLLRQKYNHKIGRSTIYNAIQNDPEVREAAKQCEGVTFDICYRGMFKRAQDGNARDQRILFNRLAGSNGMPDPKKIELTGANGKPVQHEVIANGDTRTIIAGLSDDDLDEMLLLVNIIDGPKS